MITLQPTSLHWISVDENGSMDLCAHGGVDFRIGDDVLSDPSESEWSTSAAALYLLRTLSRPHVFARATKFRQPLIPCCGHVMYQEAGSNDVMMLGCPNGVDVEVTPLGDRILIATGDGRKFQVLAAEWRDAVCHFSDLVEEFYTNSAPKALEEFDEVDRGGYETFRAEWSRRRHAANS